MSEKLLSIPKKPTGSFPPVLRLLDAYFSSLDPLPQKQRCLSTMLLYLKNILMSPQETKYLSIRLRNVKFAKDVGHCAGGDLVLLAIGFQKQVVEFEEYLILPDNIDIATDYWRVKKYSELMDEAIINDKNAPKNKLRAEKEAKEAAVRLIEEDSMLRKLKQKRDNLSTNRLNQGAPGDTLDRSARHQARMAAQQRLEALSKPAVVPTTMMPTPSLSHLGEDDYEAVYEPAEDSFALLDALQNDQELIRDICGVPLVLEVGSGTGIVSTFLQQSILPTSIHLCTDINEFACKTTLETSSHNVQSTATVLDSVRTSLTDGLRARHVDLLVFNPPYVPTELAEIDTQGSIAAAWAGGLEGMNITNDLIARAGTMLSDRGLFYLVTVARNKPAQILTAAATLGLQGNIVLDRRAGREKLSILRFHKAIDLDALPIDGRPSATTQVSSGVTSGSRRQASESETRRLDAQQTGSIGEDRAKVGELD